MSLTGIPLILLAACVTVGSLGATVLVWRRWGRWRYVVRPAAVLLTEALLTLTVGLAFNRSEQFYPSWAALFATADPKTPTYHTTAGTLDGWLAGQPDDGLAKTFPWQPADWTRWHLAAPPTVTVPAGYVQHPGWRYSAVVVMADTTDGWQAGARVPAVPGPTVLVTLTTTAATTAATLGVTVPSELERDLRVTAHRWALVTSARDAPLARQVVSTTGGRYPAVAFVGVAAPGTRPSPATAGNPKARGAGKPKGKPAGASTGQPAAGAPAGPLPTGIVADYFPVVAKPPASVTAPLRAALAWAAAQTPLPLAASAPEPKYLPVPPKKSQAPSKGSNRGPRPAGQQAKHHTNPTPLGGPDGSGQPRP